MSCIICGIHNSRRALFRERGNRGTEPGGKLKVKCRVMEKLSTPMSPILVSKNKNVWHGVRKIFFFSFFLYKKFKKTKQTTMYDVLNISVYDVHMFFSLSLSSVCVCLFRQFTFFFFSRGACLTSNEWTFLFFPVRKWNGRSFFVQYFRFIRFSFFIHLQPIVGRVLTNRLSFAK